VYRLWSVVRSPAGEGRAVLSHQRGGKHEPNTPLDRETQNVEREVLPPELYRDDRPGMIQELLMSDRGLCEWRGSGELNVLGKWSGVSP
jgi:hypothetical protein